MYLILTIDNDCIYKIPPILNNRGKKISLVSASNGLSLYLTLKNIFSEATIARKIRVIPSNINPGQLTTESCRINIINAKMIDFFWLLFILLFVVFAHNNFDIVAAVWVWITYRLHIKGFLQSRNCFGFCSLGIIVNNCR